MKAPLAALLALVAAGGGLRAQTHADGLAEACLAAPRAEAVAPCERALAAAPGDLALERQLAWAYLASYRETDAVDRFAAIARRRPADAQAQFDLAAVLAGLRDYPRALDSLRAALRLAPRRLTYLQLGALLYEQTGAAEAAFEMHLRLALAGQPIGMFDLAEDFALGRGTEPDQRRARQWYTRAAEAGHVMAMSVLAAKLDSRAFGTPPEPENAAYWRRRAEQARVRR